MIAGYTDTLSVAAGEKIGFKVSSLVRGRYSARLVRMRYCDPNPQGPGLQEDDLSAVFEGRFPSRHQTVHRGSYGLVEDCSCLAGLDTFSFVATMWPTRFEAGPQVIMGSFDPGSNRSNVLGLNGGTGIFARIGDTTFDVAAPDGRLAARKWYRVWLSVDARADEVRLGWTSVRPVVARPPIVEKSFPLPRPRSSLAGKFLIAAEASFERPIHHFNGKIERPRVFRSPVRAEALADCTGDAASSAPVADWNFAHRISTMGFRDCSGSGLHGRLINAPLRGVTGSNWTGEEMCWRHAPDHYGAIHFHDDDLHDCGWMSDFEFEVPGSLASGAYGVRIVAGDFEDVIPFYVVPAAGSSRAKVAVVIPTLTYIAYGNHARGRTDEKYLARARAWGARTCTPDDFVAFGRSTYNLHSDGSGMAFASARRPMLNMRPGYLTFGESAAGSGVHHYAADCYLLSWLDRKGFPYDVLTDAELHEAGSGALDPYRVVLTASHPEYHTESSLDAYQAWLEGGGRLMYLGGNGFYWRVALNAEIPGLLEVRRNESGIRSWASRPGEYYHCLDGTYGGLWRSNGRPPQVLTGVGFTAQGPFHGTGYRRTRESYAPELEWMFEGVAGDTFGDFGFAGGGAAGYELDRADPALGTPENAVCIARSQDHGPEFELVYEDRLWPGHTTTGDGERRLVRADMVVFETSGGGRVFSTGSITYTGSLPWNDYDNAISTLTGNVLAEFMK